MLFLSQLSERDIPWEHHAHKKYVVSKNFQESNEFFKRGQQMMKCCSTLKFNVVDGNLKLAIPSQREALKGINGFCKDRLCPVCQWRRALRWRSEMYQVMPQLETYYSGHRWIMLTLTVRNCKVEELRKTIQHMTSSLHKWTSNGGKKTKIAKRWPAIGWIRSVEITHNRETNLSHPHIHILMMVKPNYYKSSDYIKQGSTLETQEWSHLWRQAAKLDYHPIVDVRAIDIDKNRNPVDPKNVIPEILKYTTKESDLVFSDKNWLFEYARQIKKLRLIESCGIFKEYLAALNQDPEDLIGATDNELPEDSTVLMFKWDCKPSLLRYVLAA